MVRAARLVGAVAAGRRRRRRGRRGRAGGWRRRRDVLGDLDAAGIPAEGDEILTHPARLPVVAELIPIAGRVLAGDVERLAGAQFAEAVVGRAWPAADVDVLARGQLRRGGRRRSGRGRSGRRDRRRSGRRRGGHSGRGGRRAADLVAVASTNGVGETLGVGVKVGLGVLVGGKGVAFWPDSAQPATASMAHTNVTRMIRFRRIRNSPRHRPDGLEIALRGFTRRTIYDYITLAELFPKRRRWLHRYGSRTPECASGTPGRRGKFHGPQSGGLCCGLAANYPLAHSLSPSNAGLELGLRSNAFSSHFTAFPQSFR